MVTAAIPHAARGASNRYGIKRSFERSKTRLAGRIRRKAWPQLPVARAAAAAYVDAFGKARP